MDNKDRLKLAKEALDSGSYDKETIEYIFPELAESEDERIRKELIEHIKANCASGFILFKKFSPDEVIAWLERQGKESSWKPSKEEMDVLYGLAYITNQYDEHKEEVITRLYQDLKREFLNGSSYENMFPTNTSTEDDVRRRSIIQVLEYARSLDAYNKYGKADIDKNIAWLEKQGETREINPTLQEKERMDDAFTKMMFKGKTALEAIHEEKVDNANKAEPKFHKGDWIINKSHDICLITDIDLENGYYICESNRFGNTDGDIDLTDKAFHLWTIQDAEDGDVLAVDSMPFIYNGSKNEITVGAYCGFNAKHKFSFAYNYVINQNITPATKEQRELLFSKMKEAGYEWNEEKKELKKIEKQSEQNSPVLSNSSNIGKNLQVDGFNAELNALLKKYEHLSKKELQEPLEFYLGVVRDDLDIVREEKPKWNEEMKFRKFDIITNGEIEYEIRDIICTKADFGGMITTLYFWSFWN